MHPIWGLWGVWGIGMMVMMLMFWGVVIAGIVVAIRWMVSHDRALRPSDPARQEGIRGEETGPLVIDPASGDRPNRRLLPACGCHSRGPVPSDGGPRRLPALSLSRRAATMWPPLTVPSVSEAST